SPGFVPRVVHRGTAIADMAVPGKAEPSTEASAPEARERGAQATTQPGAVRSVSAGGEGGIRTRGAFAHRFSRAAPSTTRTPLRGRGYQRPLGIDIERPFGGRGSPF